jgi:hypothetical protein
MCAGFAATMLTADAFAQKAKKPREVEQTLLTVDAYLGTAIRLDDPPAFDLTTRAGALFGVGGWVSPGRGFALGLAFENLGLGHEDVRSLAGDHGSIDRTLNTLWGRVGLDLVRAGPLLWNVTFGPGLVWQSANVIVSNPFGVETLRCSVTDSMSFAVGLGSWGAWHLGHGVHALFGTSIQGNKLSSDPLGNCVLGAGSATVFTAEVGLAKTFKL